MLAAAKNSIDVAQANALDAQLRPNPAVSVESSGYSLFSSNRPPFLDNQQFTARIDQELELGGRRGLRREVAKAGIGVAESLVADQERRLVLEVKRSYFAIVLAKADVGVAQTALDEIDRVLSLNQARYRQGEISGVEVRRIQVERLRFVDDVFSAQLALRNGRSALLALLNAPDLSAEFDVDDSLAAPPTTSTVVDRSLLRETALQLRPDLAAARASFDRASTETRLQRALRTPNITLGGGYERNFGTNALVFGITVPLPLTNKNQGGIARAIAESERAKNLMADSATSVLLDVQQAVNAVETANARVRYIEKEYLTPARESRDIVLEAYRLGTADLIDYLDAQRAFRDTLRTYNRALYDQRLSIFQLSAATGSSDDKQVKR
jgi:cobalt-zinc-cadmium efflux system outer membrane protein